VYEIDSVPATANEKVETRITTTSTDNNDLHETMTTTAITDPWMLFLYALKAPATKEKYIQRLTKFLDFLGYQGTKEEKALQSAHAPYQLERPFYFQLSTLSICVMLVRPRKRCLLAPKDLKTK
jgi:hypothetical protein